MAITPPEIAPEHLCVETMARPITSEVFVLPLLNVEIVEVISAQTAADVLLAQLVRVRLLESRWEHLDN